VRHFAQIGCPCRSCCVDEAADEEHSASVVVAKCGSAGDAPVSSMESVDGFGAAVVGAVQPGPILNRFADCQGPVAHIGSGLSAAP